MRYRSLFALMLSAQVSTVWAETPAQVPVQVPAQASVQEPVPAQVPVSVQAGTPAPAQVLVQSVQSVQQAKLDNGLTILVKEDHRAPVLTSQIWYKIGASDEPDGVTGISHILEHMMFKGTKNLAPGEFSKRVAKVGATENAFTSQDYTAYFQTVEKSHLKTMLSLEAERMGSLKLLDEELQKERQVVLEERRMRTEDNPNARLYERFNALAFDASPYRRPVIGWQSDIEGYQLAELQYWYERWYAPNNATLVVVGDVTLEQVKQAAQETLGLLPSRVHGNKLKVPDVLPVGEKRLTMQDERTKVPMVMMGYAVPSLLSAEHKADAYALAVLAEILDGGSSARFSKELVRGQQKLTEASADYDLYARLSTQFMLSAVPAEGVSLAQAEVAVQETIAKVIAEGISSAELARVQASIEASRVFEADSIFYQAMKLGEAATIGLELSELEAYPERIRAVTADQVVTAAKRWLVNERLSVAHLLPKTTVIAQAKSPIEPVKEEVVKAPVTASSQERETTKEPIKEAIKEAIKATTVEPVKASESVSAPQSAPQPVTPPTTEPTKESVKESVKTPEPSKK